MSAPGKFISLEGVDGAGKSSHIQLVADTAGAGGRHVVVTREPGGTEFGEQLRKLVLGTDMLPLTETLLLVAARAEHVHRVIRPALAAGTWIVCDRFADATAAYQGAGKGVDGSLIDVLARAAHEGCRPDRTLLFDCSYDVAAQRLSASGRAADRFEREDRAFFERVRASYLAAARAEPERFRVIDASRDHAGVRAQVGDALKGL